jgi:hypothetical protein
LFAGSDAGAAVPKSGSRISVTMEHLNGADGAITQPRAHLHDEFLNVDCSLQTASDGVPRYLPAGSWFRSGFFADASCAYRYFTFGDELASTDLVAFTSQAAAAPARGRRKVR